MIKKMLFFALTGSALIFSGCGNEREQSLKVNLSVREDIPVKKSKDLLLFGVSGIYSFPQTYRLYKPFIDYLSKTTGKNIKLVQRPDYAELSGLLKEGKIDFARIAAGAYVGFDKEAGAEILAVESKREEKYYRSFIIVRSDSPIKEFGDLRGKSFAFVDPNSLSGYYFATYLISKAGFDVRTFFSRVVWSRSHDNSIRLVYEREADGACAASYILESSPLKEKIRIIGKSPPLFRGPMLAGKSMKPELRGRIKRILLNMHRNDEGKNALKSLKINKFISGKDSDYDFAREIAGLTK
ncbi:MAG: phosphate/phosphite/phosphonate ABC transporter substrate-binding protein [Elusimicrobia bacterium]|nr:phosphate/phosphite/phosphonate ABC transporter substrate-binding protein [Elusimicrobiota bacterium]